MKRWTFRIVLCLLLGVVTTVAVAWGLAVTTADEWQSGAREMVPTNLLQLIDVSTSGPGYEWKRSSLGVRETIDAGLPLLALRITDRQGGIGLFETTKTSLLLQIRTPIFPGFVINTLFYALIWFGIILGWRANTRIERRRRGRCVKCGYDLRGSPDAGCSECGWGRAA